MSFGSASTSASTMAFKVLTIQSINRMLS